MKGEKLLGFNTTQKKSIRAEIAESGVITPQANITNSAVANGSDLATTQALANDLKVKVNAILVALRNAGILV